MNVVELHVNVNYGLNSSQASAGPCRDRERYRRTHLARPDLGDRSIDPSYLGANRGSCPPEGRHVAPRPPRLVAARQFLVNVPGLRASFVNNLECVT